MPKKAAAFGRVRVLSGCSGMFRGRNGVWEEGRRSDADTKMYMMGWPVLELSSILMDFS